MCCFLFQAFNSKSPTNGTGTMRIGSSKPYRHISLMPLSTVKRVVDIREAEGNTFLFNTICAPLFSLHKSRSREDIIIKSIHVVT